MKQVDAILIAVVPIYAMIIAAVALHPEKKRFGALLEVGYPPAVVYERCVPLRPNQRADGSGMYFREERIHLSQCWEDS